MPITTLGSYVPTCDEFITHWGLVNAELGSTMILQGAFAVADFTAMRDALAAKMTLLVGATNTVEQTSSVRSTTRIAMRESIRQFRAQVGNLLPGTPYESALPDLPQENSGEGIFVTTMDDVANIWTQIDADTTIPGFTPPLTLSGGSYALAQFTTDVQAMRDAFKAWRDADKTLEVEIDRRDAMLDPIKERMGQYQKACIANLPTGHALLASVPKIYPAAGSTPDAVTLTGAWEATLMMAQLSWTESTDSDLLQYAVRMTPGPDYDTANDVHVATILPGQLTHDTADGLANPGDVASYKVYVMLTTGNEAGSNTVTITRP